jgi:hypothetical protein
VVIAERSITPLAVRSPAIVETALALTERTAGLLQALEQAHDLDDVLRLDQQASALSGLARAARVGLEQQNQLAATRVRIQHKAGSLLIELANAHRPWRPPRVRGKGSVRPQLPAGTLKQYSISGQESSNWQSLASLPLAEVETRLDELVTAGAEVTSSEFVRRGRASLRTDRNSRRGASPSELRLRAALTNVRRVRGLTSAAEWDLAHKIADCLRAWQRQVPVQTQRRSAQAPPSRPDLERVIAVCLACGRDRELDFSPRCACGGAWVATLR